VQEVEVLGGISFFKKLLYERDAHIAFLASRYLLQVPLYIETDYYMLRSC